jgi:hypothetical protein
MREQAGKLSQQVGTFRLAQSQQAGRAFPMARKPTGQQVTVVRKPAPRKAARQRNMAEAD